MIGKDLKSKMFRKRLFAGAPPANKNEFAGVPPANKNQFAGALPKNKNQFAGAPRPYMNEFVPTRMNLPELIQPIRATFF